MLPKAGGIITNILLALALVFPPFPGVPTLDVPMTPVSHGGTILPVTGEATYYGRGIFDSVVLNRVRWGQIRLDECSTCLGYVAMLWPADIGRRVCVDTGNGIFGPYLVADTAADVDRQMLLDRGWVLDVMWRVWFNDWHFPRKPMSVTVMECE